MTINYEKIQQSYGNYRTARVIWITTLKDEHLLKCDVLDKDGTLLYRVIEPPESDNYELADEGKLTKDQVLEIGRLMETNNPLYEWDQEDMEDTILMLGSFGKEMSIQQWMAKTSFKNQETMLTYVVYSGESLEESQPYIEHLDKKLTEDEIIEQHLLQKIQQDEEIGSMEVTIARSGMVSSYFLTFETERG
ncbi:MAG: hypothetical protein L0M04_06695 [Enterococcus sp.]|jgi:hypothetical protein|uniref:hypothetical protein n=1 Tax=Enterococcus TaxID=1350 RepID=UPI000DF5EC1E|nr:MULTISPECIES: hypothetical protein [Enterococcus]AXG40129.1 hypothetical protein EGCR1_15525 [Enterococcus gilvus]MDN6004896.1 hypothetical protein [Enterococcus sp.]MDN6216053.1 hypothetical protein [Enterococcus sp.]MDN6516784.1 hypothetical protein [Enterococcus sp.]MDN6560477.1 hypothetical protein [Enterococcus sp.]